MLGHNKLYIWDNDVFLLTGSSLLLVEFKNEVQHVLKTGETRRAAF